jgi:drug/metabolite transporter (DMT)-like permease
MNMGMDAAKLWPFLLAVGGLASLHLLLKVTPAGANSGATLTVAYLVASLACLAAYPVLTPSTPVKTAFASVPWHALAMGVAIACCEIGVLLAYRAGWPVGSTGVSISASITLILLPVGILFFGEALTLARMSGIAMTVGGLYLLAKN